MKSCLFFFFLLCLFFLCSCSKDDKTAGGITEDQGVAVIDKNIAGVSQKGPFVVGSSVKLYELESNFTQTGRLFNGKIESDLGEFCIKNVQLKSRYAWLETNGYYRNEVSGLVSSGPITLYAISDLEQRDNVNLNILTHLEYDRVFDLLSEGVDFREAKEKVENEILSIFEIKTESGFFEDLNIFEKGNDAAVLLAVSVLLQGNRSEGELTELLMRISHSISNTGTWDDDSIKANIADWSESADLASIRSNVEQWSADKFVPPFEKYVKNYWWMNYGLGNCGTGNENDTGLVSNPLSLNFGLRYHCVNGDWKKVHESPSSPEALLFDFNEPLLGKIGSGFDAWNYQQRDVQWYVQTDKNQGGEISIVNVNGESYEDLTLLTPEVYDSCKGMCGSYTIASGWDGCEGCGYVQTGIYSADTVFDATDWLGVCVVYQSSQPMTVRMRNAFADESGWDLPDFKLPASEKLVLANLPWAVFKQAGWGPVEVSSALAAENLVGVYFQFYGKGGAKGTFSIVKFGAYGTCE